MYVDAFFVNPLAAGNTCKPHSHPFWEFILAEGSGGFVETKHGKSPFKSGDLILHEPELSHVCHTKNKSVHFCLGLRGPELQHAQVRENLIFPGSTRIQNAFRDIAQELNEQKSFFRETARARSEEIVWLVKRHFPELGGPRSGEEKPAQQIESQAHNVKSLIDERYRQKLSLSFLSAQVFLSKDYLRHVFKEKYGISPMQYLIQKRVEAGQELLGNTDLSVREIARECGFENDFYFSRLFKQVTRISPLAYRKQNRRRP